MEGLGFVGGARLPGKRVDVLRSVCSRRHRVRSHSKGLWVAKLRYGTRFGVTPEEEEEVEVEQHMRSVEGLLRAGYHDQSFKRYRHLNETNRLRPRQYDKSMKLFGELDSLRVAWMIFDDFCSEDCWQEPQLSSYNTIMHQCMLRKDTAKIKVAYSRLMKSDHSPNLFSFKTYIQCLSEVGEVREIEDALKDMEAFQIKPDVHLLRSNLKMYANLKDVEGVKSSYNRILSLGLKPDKSTYNLYINAVGRQGTLEEAEKAFDTMEKSRGMKPDVVTFNTLIKLQIRNGRLDRAKHYYQLMIARGVTPSEVTFSILLSALVRSGDARSVKSAFREMEKYGITPQVYHFNSLMDIHLKSRNHEEVFDLFLEIRRLGYRADRSTYNLVLTAYVRERREIDALATFEDMMMKHVRPDRNTFALLMRLYSSAEDVEKCRSWFQRMIKDGVAPGEINYALLIEAFLRAGLVEDAKVAALEVEAKDITPRTRLSICNMRLALVLKDRMRARKMAEDLWLNRKDWRFELNDVENIIQILSHANENEIVLKFEEFLYERGWEPSVRTRRIVKRIKHPDLMRNETQNEQSAAFVEMIDRFARASDLIRAKRAFNRMLEEGVNPTTEVYNAMIRAYCFSGEIGMALRTLGELRTSLFLEPDALSYKPVVLALVREKQLDKAKSLIEEARAIGLTVSLSSKQPNPSSASGDSVPAASSPREQESV
ncbi:hypothetical protein NDN08_006101 [Rhodosorus marinus]|uniref:Pentacotripeptide-repeat region of PRORP domain-containing protein n=1 Tax=Rhodosorus marinus TaxID=101924 RepID=A0AAV8UJU7_9RHOD|nr:hypothetical protein NDN08_006101 [Rhodosorus marinus]